MSVPTYRAICSIPGWFPYEDYIIMSAFLNAQQVVGDIVEVGPYLGKCTVVLAAHCRSGERLHVVDLFGKSADTEENRAEVVWNDYGAASRRNFEHHFSAFHDSLPRIWEGDSRLLLESLQAQSVRFFHIDGSHTRSKVHDDLERARSALVRGGIIVLDDYRTLHAPGVAAAVWPMLDRGDLQLLALTGQKMYLSDTQLPSLTDSVLSDARECGVQVAFHSVADDERLIARFSIDPPKPAYRRVARFVWTGFRAIKFIAPKKA